MIFRPTDGDCRNLGKTMNLGDIIARRASARRGRLGVRAAHIRPAWEVPVAQEEEEDQVFDRPHTRGECVGGARPCLYVGCRHNLYLDVNLTGGLKLNFPDLEPEDLVETCSLDVADRGTTTLEDVGHMMNLTRERVRQIEVRALLRVRVLAEDLGGEE